jgi:hypothetical protein
MSQDGLKWRPSLAPETVGRETLEASRGSLAHILELLEIAERSLNPCRPAAADQTAVVRSEVERVLWMLSRLVLELHLDRLLEVNGWEHPTQVLERPRPEIEELLSVCQGRIENTLEPLHERRLLAVREKLERAQRIAVNARKRRGRRQASEPEKDNEDMTESTETVIKD